MPNGEPNGSCVRTASRVQGCMPSARAARTRAGTRTRRGYAPSTRTRRRCGSRSGKVGTRRGGFGTPCLSHGISVHVACGTVACCILQHVTYACNILPVQHAVLHLILYCTWAPLHLAACCAAAADHVARCRLAACCDGRGFLLDVEDRPRLGPDAQCIRASTLASRAGYRTELAPSCRHPRKGTRASRVAAAARTSHYGVSPRTRRHTLADRVG